MPILPYVADADQAAAAFDLVSRFGADAARQAALRARRSRHLGNHLHFCRWRQVERLTALLTVDAAVGTVN